MTCIGCQGLMIADDLVDLQESYADVDARMALYRLRRYC
jgi:hypothetical protein